MKNAQLISAYHDGKAQLIGTFAEFVFSGAFTSSLDISSSLAGKIGIGGGLSSSAGEAFLSQDGKGGSQGSLNIVIAELIAAISGKEGSQGQLSSHVSLLAQIAGAVTEIFEGSISGYAGILSSNLLGYIGVGGSLSSQILLSTSLSGLLGVSGLCVNQLDDLGADLNDLPAVISGQITASVSVGADLTGKLGIEGHLVSSLDIDLFVIGFLQSDRIYQIVITTKTGEAVFLPPQTGTAIISTKTANIEIITS